MSSGIEIWPFSDVRVGRSQGSAASASPAASGRPGRTFAKTSRHSEDCAPSSSRGRTSVTSGPPPRMEVRLPAPPEGANVWSVQSAMAASAGARLGNRSRFTIRSAFFDAVELPGESMNSISTGLISDGFAEHSKASRSWRKRGPSPARAKLGANGASASRNRPASGRSSRDSQSAPSFGGSAIETRPIRSSRQARLKSARGQASAVTPGSAIWSGRMVTTSPSRKGRDPRVGYQAQTHQSRTRLPPIGLDVLGIGKAGTCPPLADRRCLAAKPAPDSCHPADSSCPDAKEDTSEFPDRERWFLRLIV